MKKVINITLSSIVFAIEQDAYEALASYLESVKQHLAGNADYAEVTDDIENAIADKFMARKRNQKFAVTAADVTAVISEMGDPASFTDAAEETEAGTTTSANTNAAEKSKRLYRDTDDAVIAGVASGIAQYFKIDPVIVRLLFVISVFFSGIGILAYIIFWLVVPAATTTTQKYANAR